MKNRDSGSFHNPRMPGWDQVHILFPASGGGHSYSSSEQRVYLHDYPLPSHEILHFFGFSLELGVREIWDKHTRPMIPKELERFPETIDLLGCYRPVERTIVIYEQAILDACQRHAWDHDVLREVVRIHEYMHALHHLGSLPTARSRRWENLLVDSPNEVFLKESSCLFEPVTDLDMFSALRTRWFRNLKTREAEYVAQTGTALYANYLSEIYGPRIGDKKSAESIFWELMEQQPPNYKITPINFPSSFWVKGRSAFRKTLIRGWEARTQGSEISFPFYLEGNDQKLGREDVDAILGL